MLRTARTVLSRAPKALAARTYATEAHARVACGLVLVRIPQITREPTPFEKKFWEYSAQQTEDASLPFATEIYFKKGSLNERKWNERQALLGGAAPGAAAGEAQEELPNEASDDKDIFSSEYEANSRTTEADLKKDTKSLERSLENHLYLVVKTKNPQGEAVWEFPSGNLKEGENLYQSARRELGERLGDNLDYWQVGISPIGHLVSPTKTTFFMKTVLLGGQVEPASPEISDFAWLNLQELESYLAPEYYENAKEILSL